MEVKVGMLRCVNGELSNALKLTNLRCFTSTVFAAFILAW